MIDEREMYELLGDEVIVDGVTYRKRPAAAGHPCWDGGPIGGIVFINWLNSVKRTVDERNPWKVYGGSSTATSFKTFERAAIVARKYMRREYDEAKKTVAAYEEALKPPPIKG